MGGTVGFSAFFCFCLCAWVQWGDCCWSERWSGIQLKLLHVFLCCGDSTGVSGRIVGHVWVCCLHYAGVTEGIQLKLLHEFLRPDDSAGESGRTSRWFCVYVCFVHLQKYLLVWEGRHLVWSRTSNWNCCLFVLMIPLERVGRHHTDSVCMCVSYTCKNACWCEREDIQWKLACEFCFEGSAGVRGRTCSWYCTLCFLQYDHACWCEMRDFCFNFTMENEETRHEVVFDWGFPEHETSAMCLGEISAHSCIMNLFMMVKQVIDPKLIASPPSAHSVLWQMIQKI